jgi:opacity protein-like surface antigen
MSRSMSAVAFVGALMCMSVPAAAQNSRAYIQGVSGFAVHTESTEVGFALGVQTTRWLRVGGEVGRVADLTPRNVRAQFDDPMLADLGVRVTPRSPALYGLASGTVLMPLFARIEPYAGAGLGVARVARHLEIKGTSPTAQMIRDDYADNTQTATRTLADVHAGVAVPLHGGIAANVGYRYTRVFDESWPLSNGRVELGLTVGF